MASVVYSKLGGLPNKIRVHRPEFTLKFPKRTEEEGSRQSLTFGSCRLLQRTQAIATDVSTTEPKVFIYSFWGKAISLQMSTLAPWPVYAGWVTIQAPVPK